MGDLGAPVGTECVEESLQGGLGLALPGPHQPAGVVVDDHGQEQVTAAVGDLVDPDPGQVGELIGHPACVGPDPGDDAAHGAPGDPHQLGGRLLRGLGTHTAQLPVKTMTWTVSPAKTALLPVSVAWVLRSTCSSQP